MSAAMAERRVVVFLSHADAGALRLACSVALAAAAAGDRVDVYLFGLAVPAVVEAYEGEPDEPGALLHQARAEGTCRLIACSESDEAAGARHPSLVEERPRLVRLPLVR